MNTMGNFDRDDRRGGGFRGGRSSFGGGDRGSRPMFDAICSNCGRACQVPFRPTNGKPVYCSDCFEKMGGRNDRQGSDRPRFDDRKPSFDQNKATLDALNSKLDKILNLLQPKVEVP